MERSVAARMAAAAVAAGDDGPQAAVAARDDGPQAAVAALSAIRLNGIRVTQPFKLINVALKWLRDTHENPRGFPTVETIELTDTDPLPIGVIETTTGMDYSFKGGGE